MKSALRIGFLAMCAGLVVYGIRAERHAVHRLDAPAEGAGAQAISGGAFVEGATVDQFMLKDGVLYDSSSLPGAMAGSKDCKT